METCQGSAEVWFSVCKRGDSAEITHDTTPERIFTEIQSGGTNLVWRTLCERIREKYSATLLATGDKAAAKISVRQLKLSLPGILFSGTFTRRANAQLKKHAGLLCVDLDDVPNLSEVQRKLEVDPHVFMAFISPTGQGLKVVFKVPAKAEQHHASFDAACVYIATTFGPELGLAQDKACREVSRQCFMSHDPLAHFNPDAIALPVPDAPPQETVPHGKGARPSPASPGGTTPCVAVRKGIAEKMFSSVVWHTDVSGPCECPGIGEHTSGNGARDCEIHIDGAPNVHCFHASCAGHIAQANENLQKAIGQAEWRIAGAEKPKTRDEEAYLRLAALSPADYDRCRKIEAKTLGIRNETLDAAVLALRAPAGATNAQGTAVDLPDVVPWPDEVDGAEVLSGVAEVFTLHLALPDGAADALALWAAHCHCYEAFVHSPRLNAFSPEKGCGKTLLLDVLASLVPRPLRTESLTAAVLFRLVEQYKPTLLLDECDTYLNDAEELRGLLNAGHKRGARAYRCEGESNTVRGFNAFAPAALAGIGSLPGTLHDRSVIVRLVRAKPGEVATRFDSRKTAHEIELCRKLARWTADNAGRLAESDPVLPSCAFNRTADNWRPLFAVAEAAGGTWPGRAAAAFAKLTAGDDLDAHGIGTLLLADIEAVFAAAGADRLPSAKLASALGDMEGRPWAEFGKHRKPLSPNQLANQLRKFAVTPHNIRFGNDTPKGYELADFGDAFSRFLPKDPVPDRHTATTAGNIDSNALSEPPQERQCGALETAVSTNEDGPCGGVADWKPQPAENAAFL